MASAMSNVPPTVSHFLDTPARPNSYHEPTAVGNQQLASIASCWSSSEDYHHHAVRRGSGTYATIA